VETLVKIAQTLGMGVVATGVENQEQLDMLARIGVKRIQGQALSKAISAQSFALLLQKGVGSPLK
jgi:EAL domain-containing protein (putative c-di-GMP-specific phosphodiesterase class I)